MSSKIPQGASTARYFDTQSGGGKVVPTVRSSSGGRNDPHHHHVHFPTNAEESELGELKTMLERIQLYRRSLPPLSKLHFNVIPNRIHQYRTRHQIAHPSTYTEPFDLHPTHTLNRSVRRVQEWLFMMDNLLANFEAEYVQDVKGRCLHELLDIHLLIETHKETQWCSQLQSQEAESTLSLRYNVLNTEHYVSPKWLGTDPLTLEIWLMIVLLHFVFNAAREVCRFVGFNIRDIFSSLGKRLGVEEAHWHRQLSESTFIEPDVIAKKLNLEPTFTSYVCCPKCFALYPEYDDTGERAFPNSCDWQETKESAACQSRLSTVRNIMGRQHKYPIRRFLLQDFKAWFGRFIARPGIEDMLDRALETQFEPPPTEMTSIWHSPEIREFKVDGQLFFRYRGSEGRYIFSLFYDHFNPFGNKISGKQTSVGAIYMVCLNLPLSLMYRPENMFLVGLVPGPNKPSLTQINRLTEPLVDALLLLFKPGVWFSCTNNYPGGRLIKILFWLLVSDLVAIRQFSGLGSHSSTFFCVWCGLKKADIDNIEYQTWPHPRTHEEHMRYAQQWLNAPTLEDRGHLFEQNGVRYAEIDRLPYRQPSRHTLFDIMHGTMGAVETLLRNVFKIDREIPSGDGLPPSVLESDVVIKDEDVLFALLCVKSSLKNQLRGCKEAILRFICETQSIRRASTKKTMTNDLTVHFAQNPDALQEAIHSYQSKMPDERFHSIATKVAHKRSTKHMQPDAHQVSEIERLLKSKELANKELGNKLQKHKWVTLAQACRNAGIAILEKDTKLMLVNKLLLQRGTQTSNPAIAFSAPSLPSESARNTAELSGTGTGAPILGKEVMEALEADATSLTLPSWLVKAPENWGTAQHGSLKADEWRTVAFVSLPITLPRLWSTSSPRFQAILRNFFTFVSALRIAFSYSITEEKCIFFRNQWFAFLAEYKILYPTSTIVPNFHMIGHLPDILQRWGPCTFWRGYPFERYNGMIQNIPSNMKFGEMETTLFRKFCISANLKSIIQDPRLPADLGNIKQRLERFFETSAIETLVNDNVEFGISLSKELPAVETADIDNIVLEKLISHMNRKYGTFENTEPFTVASKRHPESITIHPSAWQLKQISFRNRVYRPAIPTQRPLKPTDVLVAHGDSYVILSSENHPGYAPCRIHSIFAHHHLTPNNSTPITEYFLVIRRYKPLSDIHIPFDCWRKFGDVAGQLFYDEVEDEIDVVSVESILSHFARTVFRANDTRNPIPGQAVMHVLPLNWY